MGLLNHLFATETDLANEIVRDDQLIAKHWEAYVESYKKKDANKPHDLLSLLSLELLTITAEEKDDEELLADVKKLSNQQKIKRVHKLQQCLAYVATKYEYVHSLLAELHTTLQHQLNLAQKIVTGSANARQLTDALKVQIAVETEIHLKISKIRTFPELFAHLAKAEYVIRKMDAHTKELVAMMRDEISPNFDDGITPQEIDEWINCVNINVEDHMHELVANEGLDYHEDSLLEFVNRPEFIELVKKCSFNIRAKGVSQAMLAAFVHVFREWYNHQKI